MTKLKVFKMYIKNIDNTNDDTNLVLASDVIETIYEAFEEEDALAEGETDQDSLG